ncbi:interleukin-12 subunit beta isoform X2 [Mastacembelus armatus]|uniref:interleukin-12 subunit beta isoform X2 n=1 Tax=Mastacembelus armatus TaxID=205130 RepID=UPI000E454701|nr:interleukin-12 subunit beta-like isoform X2 [Mastacembelus armatus]
MTLSLWTFGLLLISLNGANGINYFPENFVVAKRGNSVKLICGATTGDNVTWMFNDEMKNEDDDEDITQDGQDLMVLDIDKPLLGEYSCWKGGNKLSSTYLLLEAEEDDQLDFLTCRAKSYDCKFSCIWTQSRYTAVRLGLGNDCSEGKKSCHWVSSGEQLLDGGFQFELSHSLSPYAEEDSMLELTAEAIFDLSILRRTKRFYLRDIIQPDSPQIVRCEEMEEALKVTIVPPPTWSTPHSYFSLEHEIEFVYKDHGKTGNSSSCMVPKTIIKLRARSRDSLVPSAWSQWTPWKNVRTAGKKLCKCKNVAKYCCPDVQYEDHCKDKKGKKKRRKSTNATQTSTEVIQ